MLIGSKIHFLTDKNCEEYFISIYQVDMICCFSKSKLKFYNKWLSVFYYAFEENLTFIYLC